MDGPTLEGCFVVGVHPGDVVPGELTLGVQEAVQAAAGHRAQTPAGLASSLTSMCSDSEYDNMDTYLGDKVDAFTLESVTVTELSFDLHISLEEGENVGCPVRHCRRQDTSR